MFNDVLCPNVQDSPENSPSTRVCISDRIQHGHSFYIYSLCVFFTDKFQNHVPTGIFHRGRFARAGGATNFSHVKNQSRGHAQKVECSSTFMARPRAFRRTKNAQVRQLQRKLSNVRSARSGKATAVEHGLYMQLYAR
jgi:hypothetical protein